MDVVVVGAGSLGSLLGGLLAREHDVTLVGRDPHVEAVAHDGLAIEGIEQVWVDPAAQTGLPAGGDLALVAVKAYDTGWIAESLSDCAFDACLSVQNGLGNEATLAAVVECPVLAGTCTYGARLTDPGIVEFTGRGEIHLGDPDGGTSEIAQEVAEAFQAADVAATAVTDMPVRLWEKLAVNAAVNATTALARVENGMLARAPGGGLATAAARETARVAREQGVDLPTDRALSLTEQVIRDTAANRSSMLQDVEAGQRTEVDAINGAVVDRADDPVPVNETLTRLLRTWEGSRGLR